MSLFSQELERQLLAGLLNHPDKLAEIKTFITKEDFYSKDSKVHQTIFLVLDALADKQETVSPIVVAERIRELGVKFEDDISVTDYVQSMGFQRIDPKTIFTTAKELKKYTLRREIFNTSANIANEMKRIDPSSSISEIIDKADRIYNERIDRIEKLNDNQASNIYDKMVEVIEERGNNPVKFFGLPMPHKKLESMYGSLLRPGNITAIVARAKAGKTTFMMDLCMKASVATDVPIIHFDMGEMSEEELIYRQCAALSGVPVNLLETGEWRQNEELTKKVRAVWPKLRRDANGVSELKHYYYSVAGMSPDEMVSMLKRTYYSLVGRGKQAIFLYDYIKTTGIETGGKSEWAVVGEIIDKFKKCIQKDILDGGKPVISMITAAQANRAGIVSNRKSEQVVEDESVVGLSDRISFYASHVFLLRKKTNDELAMEGYKWGTHKLVSLVNRHLGKDVAGACNVVMVDEQPKSNFLHFDIDNFLVVERGDLRDSAASMNQVSVKSLHDDGDDSDLPAAFR